MKSRKKNVRGQISIEYLAVMAISTVMLLPLFLIFSEQTISFNNQINTAHLDRSSFELLNAVEEVFLLGPPTSMQLKLYFPDKITAVATTSTGFVFTVSTSSALHDLYVDSQLPLNLTGNLNNHKGLHVINITATTAGVVVGEVT